MAPVAALAEKFDVAVLVVCHKRKGVAGNADETAMGSVGFVGLARQVWHLSADTKNADRRLLLPGKSNLAKRAEGLAFTIAGNPAARAVGVAAGRDDRGRGAGRGALSAESPWPRSAGS